MLKGIALKILSAFLFTAMWAVGKAAAPHYPIGEIVFFRSLLAMCALVCWLVWLGEFPAALRTRRPFGHVARGLIGSGGMIFGFLSVGFLPLPDATAIGFAAPLITVVLAAVLLGETVRLYRWSAVAVGFVGVLIMLWEHLGEGFAVRDASGLPRGAIGAMLAMTGALCASGAIIQTRRLTSSERTGAIVFYFSLLTTVMGLAMMATPLVWPTGWPWAKVMAAQGWVTPSGRDLAMLVGMGIMGGVAQIAMTESFRYADASVIAPFDYTAMIWAVAIGVTLFGEPVSPAVALGSLVVAAAGIFVVWRESRLGLLRADVRRVGPSRAL